MRIAHARAQLRLLSSERLPVGPSVILGRGPGALLGAEPCHGPPVTAIDAGSPDFRSSAAVHGSIVTGMEFGAILDEGRKLAV